MQVKYRRRLERRVSKNFGSGMEMNENKYFGVRMEMSESKAFDCTIGGSKRKFWRWDGEKRK